jgi:O-antigen/teichoic acid export membrane protein
MPGFEAVKTALIVNIIQPIVGLVFAAALILFLWGVIRFIWRGSSEDARKEGRKHMFWGVIGMGIMLAAFGIVNFVFNTVNDNGNARGIDNQRVPKPSILDRGF